MNSVLGIIFANDEDAKLNELSLHRAAASIPFAGRYRLIDFALSNCVNSSITKIAIVTKSNYSSLMDHIRMGRDWDLNRKNSGIAIFPPYVSNNLKTIYKGKIDALEGIIDYIERAKEKYVLLTNGNLVANIDYSKIFDSHVENKADITILTKKGKLKNNRQVMVSKRKGDIVQEVLIGAKATNNIVDISLNTYIINKDLLINIINDAYARGYSDFEKLVFQKEIDKYKVCLYEVDTIVSVIDDIKTYYDDSMKLLNENYTKELFFNNGRIFTKVKDSVPVVFGKNSKVHNSLIADGCKINGHVENSILFRNVVIEEGVEVKNSIVMEYTVIKKNSKVNYMIADKDVVIEESRTISGHETYPVVIAKGKQV